MAENRDIEKRKTSEVQAEERRPERVIRPRTSVFEHEDAVKIIMDLPGVSRENLNISFNRGELAISGARESWDRDKMKACYCERVEGSYERVFALDSTLDASKIDAKLANGVLELTIPKIEAVKPKKIQIKAE
jgi:HSP20 family protein